MHVRSPLLRLPAAALVVACAALPAQAADDTKSAATSAVDAAVATKSTGRLRIATTAECRLKIGDAEPETLALGAAREVSLPPGDVALECTSTTTPEAKATATRTLAAGASEDVRLDVADAVVKAACADKPATFADLGGGILRHCVTKADWTAADAGEDVDLAAARALCAQRGPGWILPKADDLAALIDRTGRSSTTCGRFTCNVSPRFRLTAPTFWSNDTQGPSLGVMVNLILGGRHGALDRTKLGYRALCMRAAS